MGAGLLLLVGCIYLGVAVDYARQERWGMALCFAAYSLANIGLVLDQR